MASISQSGVREDEGMARRFALVVSLTHAHNVSAASATNTAAPPYQQLSSEGDCNSTSDGDDDRAEQQGLLAQLKVEVSEGDDGGSVVVTACCGKWKLSQPTRVYLVRFILDSHNSVVLFHGVCILWPGLLVMVIADPWRGELQFMKFAWIDTGDVIHCRSD